MFEMFCGFTPFADEEDAEEDAIYMRIIQEDLSVHLDCLEGNLCNVVTQLLERDVDLRIGCRHSTHNQDSILELMNHPYFADVDWQGLSNGHLENVRCRLDAVQACLGPTSTFTNFKSYLSLSLSLCFHACMYVLPLGRASIKTSKQATKHFTERFQACASWGKPDWGDDHRAKCRSARAVGQALPVGSNAKG